MTRVLLSASNIAAIEDGTEFDLEADTAKKLVRVLRLTDGDTFVGFDGLGREWDCSLTQVETHKKPTARAVAVEERTRQIESKLHLSVAQAIPKGDKMEFVLQKGTELGVSEFWPFEAGRSVSRVLFDEDGGARATQRTERWRKIVAGAASQCGRADVPIVHAIADFSTVVGEGTGQGRCFMLDERPEARSLREALQNESIAPVEESVPTRIMLLIGPEGGWTNEEREWADRYGVEAVSLGRRVLRTETAALVAATILSWEAGEI